MIAAFLFTAVATLVLGAIFHVEKKVLNPKWGRFEGVVPLPQRTDNVVSLDVARWGLELRKAGWKPSAELEARRQKALADLRAK